MAQQDLATCDVVGFAGSLHLNDRSFPHFTVTYENALNLRGWENATFSRASLDCQSFMSSLKSTTTTK